MWSYPLLAQRLGLGRTAIDSSRCGSSLRSVGCNVEFGSSWVVLQVKGVELFSDLSQRSTSLQTLVSLGLFVLRELAFLLLRLLRASDSLLPQGGFEPLELRAGHFVGRM